MTSLAAIKASVLSLVRRGEDGAIVPSPGIRGGNYLYLWMHAFVNRRAGRSTPLLFAENMKDWLQEFPALHSLTLRRSDLKFTTPRFIVWPVKYGQDFTQEDIREFIGECLLSSESFRGRLNRANANRDENQLLINIRRGDYYSKKYIEIYGIDLPPYLAEAMSIVGNFDSVRVISDDLDWCIRNKGIFPNSKSITFGGIEPGVFGDLASIASARSLILPNSTFSYWGGFISDLLSDFDNQVIVPKIHERHADHQVELSLPHHWQKVQAKPAR